MVMRETRDRGVLATTSGMHKLQNAKTTQSNGKGKPLTYSDIAEVVGVDEKTVERFFRQEQAIDESSARAICQALNVNANEVIDWSPWVDSKDRNGYLSNLNEFKTDTAIILNTSKASLDNRKHNISDDKHSYAVAGNYSPVNEPKIKAILALLRDISGDHAITIVEIEKGSIKLILEGSQAGLERLEQRFKTGELTQVLDIFVENVCFIGTDTAEFDEEIKSTSKKRLALTIAGDVTQADIAKLKTSLAETSDRQVKMKSDRKSYLIQEITQNKAQDIYMFLAGDIDCSDAKLTRVNFNDEDLSHVDLSYSNLFFAKLSRADLSHTDLSHADISHGDLSGANLSGANLSGADLSHANLTFANLSGADLSGSHLSGAYLGHANLSHAKLSGASLIFADLSGADLSDADMSGANVENARFGNNPGIFASIKNNLIQRGAIFEDSPGDNSQVLIPR
ncbi:MAG: pentapeptide repeat-containing protein [Calothrix sp. MO_167.B42]|nr:pentapeptide repeat-containing protein [Calothrix sp. MO_167.B42]